MQSGFFKAHHSKYNKVSIIDPSTGKISKNYIEEEIKYDPKYKTEMCQKYVQTGKCPYGIKCRFAHGKEELISKIQCINYKKKHCITFYSKGYCPYGSRCSFQHDEKKFEFSNISYFYLQLFLFKFSKENPSNYYTNYMGLSNLFSKRLPVFESYTTNFKENKKNQIENTNSQLFNEDRLNQIIKNNKNSILNNTYSTPLLRLLYEDNEIKEKQYVNL